MGRWLALAAVLAGGAAWAHSGAMGIVKERMDAMGIMGKALKAATLAERSGGASAQEFAALGAALQTHGGARMLALFPEGSGGGVSEVRPEIWEDWAAFERLAKTLEAQGRALAGGGDAPDLAAVQATCAACHERFRTKK